MIHDKTGMRGVADHLRSRTNNKEKAFPAFLIALGFLKLVYPLSVHLNWQEFKKFQASLYYLRGGQRLRVYA